MQKKPIMLTIRDTVEVSGIPRSAIYEAMKRGALNARKAGRRTLIAVDDLEAYLASLPKFEGRK